MKIKILIEAMVLGSIIGLLAGCSWIHAIVRLIGGGANNKLQLSNDHLIDSHRQSFLVEHANGMVNYGLRHPEILILGIIVIFLIFIILVLSILYKLFKHSQFK